MILDMAASVVARGKISVAAEKVSPFHWVGPLMPTESYY